MSDGFWRKKLIYFSPCFATMGKVSIIIQVLENLAGNRKDKVLRGNKKFWQSWQTRETIFILTRHCYKTDGVTHQEI